MEYRKLDRAMRKSDIECFVDKGDMAVFIETEPEENEEARKNIESALGRNETCVNSSPGRFTIVQTTVKTWKV